VLCILYANIVGALVGVAALLIERALPASWPRRWLWCLVIPFSMFIVGYYRVHHNWAVASALPQPQALASGSATAPGSLSILNLEWWMHTSAYDMVITRVWLTTSALLIAWALVNAWRVWRIVRLSRRQADPRQSSLVDGIPIVVTDVVGPATVGVVRSNVLVPRWVLALPAAQRQYVLRHEEEHRRAHDGIVLFLASLPLVLAPWNLALWWYLRRLSLAVEIDCDKRVVGVLGDPHAYGALLLRVAEAGSRGPRLQPAFLGIGMLERRLNQLLAPTPLRHLQRLFVPALAVALLGLVLWMPHPIPGHTSRAHSVTTHAAITSHSSTH
jgi:bla regulator protein blaR1